MGKRDFTSEKGQEPPPLKKRYEKPALQNLGTLTELTQVVGKSGLADNGRPPKTNSGV